MRNITISKICSQKSSFSIVVLSVVLLFLLMVSVHVGMVHATVINATKSTIPAYEITTRGNLFNAHGVSGKGYHDKYPLLDIKNLSKICPDEVAIFVHGWGQNETQAKERFDRIKMSLEKNNYTYPLIGFSWGSDIEWIAAKFIAKWNGARLADYTVKLMEDCKHDKVIKIRLIGHSLGARVILSALDSLHRNTKWNSNNFTITSVDLMGAAVDNEEVTKNPKDIIEDKTNWGSPKSDYGQAIEDEVINFSNLYSTEDNLLELNPEKPSYPIYPFFEGDFAVGQNGSQKLPYPIMLPENYEDINVTDKIKPIYDADGLEAEVFGLCDNTNGNPYCEIKSERWDSGFCNLAPPPVCQEQIGIGDNHAGYIGFRNNVTDQLIDDGDGAIGVVVNQWPNH